MFRLRVLGGFALEGPSGAAPPPRPLRRGDAVLAVLAVCGDLGCTRERLGALLWPESDEARASQGLRDALYAIRRALGLGAVLSGGRLLRLDPSVVDSDVLSFTQALASGRHADAVRAYGGPLLDGFHVDDAAEFERWLDGERTRLARQHAEALEHLARAAEQAGAWHEAVGWWGRAVEHDPINSHFVLQHARAMAAIGDRANALKAAEVHARRLREELDLEPDREFLAGIELIRRGEMPAPHQVLLPRTPAAAVALPPMPEESLEHLAAAPTPSGSTPPTAPRRVRRSVPWAVGVAALVVLAAVFGVGRWLRMRAADVRPPRTAIALLPCRNLSADSSHAYFASALHDEVLTRLFKVASLTVSGRTSVTDYQQTSKPLRQIGQELGVGSVAICGVQVDGNQLRVNVQLFDAATEAAIWANTYDFTLDSAFAVQSEIAGQIVAAVGATLTSAEAGAIASAPTPNSQAYEFYLQGLEYSRRPGLLRQSLESAQQLYERALSLDSAFAPAHAALSYVDWRMYRLGYDRNAASLERARREADVALRLAPDLPQAHLAVGLARYLSRGDNREALNEIQVALRGAPNDAELWGWIARVQRSLGNWDSVTAAFDRARKLDPRDANLCQTIGDTFHYLHRYREAIEAYRCEIALAPDVVQARLSLAWSYVLWKGELDTLRAVLRGLPLDTDPGMGGAGVGNERLKLAFLERRPDSILALLRLIPWAAGASAGASWPREVWAARAHALRGDTAAARAAFDAAASILDARERAHPEDVDTHGMRGAVLAALGRRAEALLEARWIEQSEAYRRDADVAATRAEILARVGETDAALADVERALAGPSTVTAPLFRLLPNWDPLRNDPRFQALLVKYANPEARTE
jgi:TolB-like protein/DNA-binding SARP family transcriptional activator